VISILRVETVVKCRFILQVCGQRNLLDIYPSCCIGCRRSSRFDNRASTVNTGRLFFPFFTNEASQLQLPIFKSPLPKLYSGKDRARLLRGLARI